MWWSDDDQRSKHQAKKKKRNSWGINNWPESIKQKNFTSLERNKRRNIKN